MSQRIAVIGSVNMDMVTFLTRFPAAGETIAAPDFALGFGGKGANQAVAAARLGGDVLMVGAVGDDIFGTDMARNLAAQGVDTRHLRRLTGTPSGVATVLVEPSGENRIIIVAGANGQVAPADIDAAGDDLRGCGLILLQLEVPLPAVYHAIRFAAAHGIPCLLNPAPAHPDLDPLRLAGLTFIAPNQTELALLTGLPVESDDQIAAAAGALLAQGVGQVIVTLGAKGARLFGPEGTVRIPAHPAQPVDTTGAGDAFIGSFARFWVESHDTTDALTRAARYAAVSVTRRGAQSSYADAAEFAALTREGA
ncbi:MAG: ribokinase [Paracoccus sp. (in: a-proteobacteria)]|uniref:ribokinase n=1 Tax=Paracoccus sp. TaxID=267 RepID=UPI0026E0E650|nr:ribokinase [Paracoccus sp. (in: a-proteobacteria)]MDO5620762.1 ribokinase [Paracoccus sp. (in: a-proteobacteria)]